LKNNKIYVGGSFTQVLGEQYPGYGLTSFTYSYDAIPTIQIQTIEDLDSVRDNLMANYILMRDLDFNDCNSYSNCENMSTYTEGLGWEPVGSWNDVSEIEHPYYGTFDGQGHTISNLYINRPSEYFVGLFGLVGEGGKIKNVGLINASISGLGYTGGLVGRLLGTVENSYAKGSVIATDECTGGLVGNHWIKESAITATIINSYSEASVSGGYTVGGLVGCNVGDVINSYSTGTVTGTNQVGGLIGWYGGGEISNSYWDTYTSGVVISDGGLGLTTEDMQSLLSYTGWDIVEMNNFDPSNASVWYISDWNDYPRLYWEYEAPEVLTKAATNFAADGATLNGELLSMDGETEVSVSFRYRQGEGEWTNVNTITKTTAGVFSSSITGLTLNTQYQYQTIVTWRGVGTVYGNIVSFTTPATPPLPSVFGPVVSNIEDIETPSNTEVPLVLTKIGTGSITFPSGLNLTDNYDQLSNLSENLVIVYEPSLNRFRAYVNSNGASFLASHGATIRFFNVRNQLGISGLTSSNFKTLLKVSVLNDSKSVVTDTSSYFDWNNASYNQDTDILTMPVNHFSEYVLGVNTGVLPSTGMSSLTMLIPLGLSLIGVGVILFSKKRYKKI
ncbi:LPXTG cell wall anchor domain-containing protein, partial [Candidatus Dojkabacteria bacterium]|nr:LPXTG cell wall anchor domain-containing protein [Candidatus Dojkabacteria bacterium]